MQKISVIMPCYNCEEFLDRSMSSVLAQTYQNWELICVDDGSNDNTYDKLLEFASKDARIKVFTKEHSGMAAPNRNYALNFVNGDFIFTLDSDDEINIECFNDCINRYNELMGGGISVDIIIPKLVFFYPNNPMQNRVINGISKKSGSYNKILSGKEAFVYSLDWSISGLGMYKMEIIKKFKWCEEGMNGDEYSSREFFINSNYVAFAKNATYIYYQNEKSITKKITPKMFDTYKTHYKLEILAKNFNLSKNIIKKINRDRYKIFYRLWKLYFEKKHHFNGKDNDQIQKFLDENQKLLQPYRTIWDYFFRKEYDKKGKSIVIFDKIKFYYKRLKNA